MRPMGKLRISSRDQNICLRNYCIENNMPFSLPIPEFVYPNCYVQLFTILNSSRALEHNLVFYSIHQISEYPGKSEFLLKAIMESFKSVHFALEQQSFTHDELHLMIQFLALYSTP